MEQNQQKQRSAAAKEFLQSLGELEDILQENSTDEEETPTLVSDTTSDIELAESADIDLSAWEDAVADIEQYLSEKKK